MFWYYFEGKYFRRIYFLLSKTGCEETLFVLVEITRSKTGGGLKCEEQAWEIWLGAIRSHKPRKRGEVVAYPNPFSPS